MAQTNKPVAQPKPAAQTNQPVAPANRPVKVFRFRGISASVFENQTHADGQPVVFYKVSVQRTYMQNGEYKHNSSFGRDDLPIAMHVLHQAWEFILATENASSADKIQE